MTETPGDAYKRGVDAGVIDTRLAGHDKHFEAINGNLVAMDTKMKSIDLSLQRLADRSESAWTPIQRLAVVVSVVFGMVGVVIAIYTNSKGIRG